MKKTNTRKVRKMGIYFKPTPRRGYYTTVPFISLSGKWLEQFGFQAGHMVDVACEEGRLTISISDEQQIGDEDKA